MWTPRVCHAGGGRIKVISLGIFWNLIQETNTMTQEWLSGDLALTTRGLRC